MSEVSERRVRVLERLAACEVDALLVSGAENRRYLSGFTGSAGWLFVSATRCALVTDGRYWTQAGEECPDLELVKFRSQDHERLAVALGRWLEGVGWKGRIGCEGSHLTVAEFREIQQEVGEMKPLEGVVEELRQIKSPAEVEALRRAVEAAVTAYSRVLEQLRPGVRERDLCTELEHQIQLCGARKPSFDSIVASGPNGACPHAGVTGRRIREGELVTFDFGALLDGYCSDLTRTAWLGELDPDQAALYRLVREAQQRALEVVAPGRKACEVDGAARDFLTEAGYGEAFSHGTGHGIGLAVHEGPRLRPRQQTELLPGMVVTVEPGLYVPGVGGCRVEDMVVVTEGGGQLLTGGAPKQEPGERHPLG